MKKENIVKKIVLLVMFFSIICFTAESALPSLDRSASKAKVNKTAASSDTGNSTVIEAQSASSEVIDTSTSNTNQTTQTAQTSLATLPNGKAYVWVSSFLSVRDEPFGTVLARLYNNDEVLIVNSNGDWYEIESDKGSGWIYGKCVFDTPNSNPSTAASDTASISNTDNNSTNKSSGTYNYYSFTNPGEYKLNYSTTTTANSQKTKAKKTTTTKKTTTNKTTTTAKKTDTKKSTKSSGSIQSKIVQAAKDIVKKYSKKGSFPYAPGLKGGRLGCAQVATTVLKKAGVLKKTSNGCKQTLSMLKQAGWKKAKVPPYKAGDVIFWTTYKPGASHVGIIMENGKNVQAMSNSSSERRPRFHKANYAKVYCVMRKS